MLLRKIFLQIKGLSHDVVDKYTDAARSARQAIREYDCQIQKLEKNLISIKINFHVIEANVNKASKKTTEYHSLASQKYSAGDNQLAEQYLVMQDIEEEKAEKYLLQKTELGKLIEKMERDIELVRGQRDRCQQELQLIEARQTIAKSKISSAKLLSNNSFNTPKYFFSESNHHLEIQEAEARAYEESLKSCRDHIVAGVLDKEREQRVQDKLTVLKATLVQ